MELDNKIADLADQILTKLQVSPLRSGEKRKRILSAALDLMAEFGYRKTTVDEIAERAGVAKGTVYLYFRDKQEILMSIVREKLAILVANVMEEIKSAEDVPGRLARAIRYLLDYHRQDVILNSIFTRNPEILAPVLTGTIALVEEVVCSLIAAQLQMGIKEGSIDPHIDPETTALILFRLNQSTIMRIKTGGDIDMEKYLSALEKLVFYGIRKRSEP